MSDDDNQPSRFLDELDPAETDRIPPAPPRAVHLPALVAELRGAVCDPHAPAHERNAAASALARLAADGVNGADPAQWWGLAPPSDDRPLVEQDEPVTVSPSRVEAFLRCELRALLIDLGATDGNQLPAAIGTLVHTVAAQATPGATLDDLERLLDESWDEIDFGARWYSVNQRARATRMLARLAEWLRAGRRRGFEVVAVEKGFRVDVGTAVLRGQVDRLERDQDGRLVVVDYKTGTTKPKSDEIERHAQLAAYQLAVEEGAFGTDERSGGAMLVQLGGSTASYVEQAQPPLDSSDEPGWISETIQGIAARMHGTEFTARAGDGCRICDLKKCCPLQPDGRQVTS